MRIESGLFENRPAAAVMVRLALEQLVDAYAQHGLSPPYALDDGTRLATSRVNPRHRVLDPQGEPRCARVEGTTTWEADVPPESVQAILDILRRTCVALASRHEAAGAQLAARDAFDILSRIQPSTVDR